MGLVLNDLFNDTVVVDHLLDLVDEYNNGDMDFAEEILNDLQVIYRYRLAYPKT